MKDTCRAMGSTQYSMIPGFLWNFTVHILGKQSKWQENYENPPESHITATIAGLQVGKPYTCYKVKCKANPHEFQTKNRALPTICV
jgi:hypothetical protein